MERPTGDLERLAYESAQRGLDLQERLLAELRARTGGLLTASSLVASFLGPRAFSHPEPRSVAIVALVAFVVSVGASVLVLAPRRGVDFAVDGVELGKRLHDARSEAPEVYRYLLHELQKLWKSNDRRIPSFTRIYNVAAAALMVEIVALAVLLGGELIR